MLISQNIIFCHKLVFSFYYRIKIYDSNIISPYLMDSLVDPADFIKKGYAPIKKELVEI